MTEPQAGTAATNPQGGGNAGTGEGTGAGGGNAGTATGAAQGSEDAAGLKAENERLKQELLNQKPHIEEANRIRAERQAAEEAARNRPPTNVADPEQLTSQDVEQLKIMARDENPAVAAIGRAQLSALRASNSAGIGVAVTQELLKQPREDRPLIEERLRRGQAQSVADAAKDIEIERLRKQAAEGVAAKAKLEELNRTPREPEPGTHIRSAPTSGGPPGGDAAVHKWSDLQKMYQSGDKALVARATDIERREAAGKANIDFDH